MSGTKNSRRAGLLRLGCSALLLGVVILAGVLLEERAAVTDFSQKNLAPGLHYWFGTDWMGRDMFARTVCGLSMSIRIGIVTSAVSAVLAFLFAAVSIVLGKAGDAAVTWLTDLFMGVPHMLLLILISFACGRGFWGVVSGIVLTHWMSLTRVLRAEMIQLRQSGYVRTAQKLGMGNWYIVRKHMIPHLLPQFAVGLVLLFPHAVLHEASITFLGFGLPPEQPAIGMILSEGMKHLVTGKWWLTVFPALLLVCVVALFHFLGSTLRKTVDPSTVHE